MLHYYVDIDKFFSIFSGCNRPIYFDTKLYIIIELAYKVITAGNFKYKSLAMIKTLKITFFYYPKKKKKTFWWQRRLLSTLYSCKYLHQRYPNSFFQHNRIKAHQSKTFSPIKTYKRIFVVESIQLFASSNQPT